MSQYNQYKKCPRSYYLSRLALDDQGKRLWQRPAAWLPQGTGVHSAAEAIRKSYGVMTLDEAKEVFRLSYAEEVNKYSEETPNFKFWFRSGPYDGETDIERRYKLGLEQVERFYEYYTEIAPEEKPWITHNGDLAVELPFEIMLGTVPVRGYIDDVIDLPKSLRVRDNKTGKDPGDVMQLKVYGVAIEYEFDVKVTSGDYWMGRTGMPTVPYNLTQWSEEWVTDEFGKLDAAIKAGEFDPDPEPSKCTMCSVAVHCEAAIFS